MYKPLQKPLEESITPESSDEPIHTDDTSQGSEYLDDAIRMVEQPLEQPKQSQ